MGARPGILGILPPMALTERDRQRAIRGKGQRTGQCWVCGKPQVSDRADGVSVEAVLLETSPPQPGVRAEFSATGAAEGLIICPMTPIVARGGWWRWMILMRQRGSPHVP
jgi:hypothetical protein